MEFSVASSMVQELSSLVFYLRNFAIPGELLIVDEPEKGLLFKYSVLRLHLYAWPHTRTKIYIIREGKTEANLRIFKTC